MKVSLWFAHTHRFTRAHRHTHMRSDRAKLHSESIIVAKATVEGTSSSLEEAKTWEYREVSSDGHEKFLSFPAAGYHSWALSHTLIEKKKNLKRKAFWFMI